MRCDEVIRELAVPSGAMDAAAVKEHLATCASCAHQAEGFDRLDRVWEDTRPAEPSERTWNRLWQRVTLAADAPATLPLRPGHRALRWWFVAIAAQAAAGVLLVFAPFRTSPQNAQGMAPAPLASAPGPVYEFDIEGGQTLFLEVDEAGDHVVCKPRLETTQELLALDEGENAEPIAVAIWDMKFFNYMESMATVASPE
jgi:hypothetical protein